MAVTELANNATDAQDDALTDKFNQLVMGVAEPTEEVEEEIDEPEVAPEPEEAEEIIPVESTQELIQESNESPIVAAIPNTITMKNSAFAPQTLKISPGTKVTWENDDTKMHIINVYLGDAFNENPRLDPGETFEFTFNNGGTYKYQDVILLDKMRGIIIVS